MKNSIFVIIGLTLFLAAKVYAYDDGDFQIWNTDYQEIKLNKKSKLVFEEEFRWGNNASEFYYQHYDLGFFYDFTKWFSAGGGYRQIYELYKGKFRPDNDPYLTATLSGEVKGFKFDDRSRMEYNDFDYKMDFWRYRNKFMVKAPWKFTKMAIQPYIADEIFIRFGGYNGLNQNRFFSGFGVYLTKHLTGEIYYMLQSTKGSGQWIDANVLGTKLKLTF